MALASLVLFALSVAAGGGGSAHAQQVLLSDRSLLSVLFDRSNEPVFLPRGDTRFLLPSSFLPEQYGNLTLVRRFGDVKRRVEIPDNTNIPDVDLSLPLQLPRNAGFSLFIPFHRRIAGRLIEVLLGASTYEEFMIILLYARARMNPQLVNYAQSVAILHRPDTRNVALPNFASVNPDRFIGGRGIFAQLRERAAVFDVNERTQNSLPIEIPRDFTGTDLDVEHRVAYFREDIGINLHHWNWHLVYPYQGPREIVNKDRRGELFYYMHQQIIARFNFERLSNKLERVKKFINWREPIEEAYFPKLDSMLSSRVWPSRQANALLHDIARPEEQTYVDLQDLERWRERIYQAIHDGRVINQNGSFVPLSERNGIDILGNLLEASDLSIHPNLYGNLHNIGHVVISFCHDPDNRHLESFGVIGDSATAMRDPIFYRWHAFIDDLLQDHKSTLSSYTRQHLGYNDISVQSLEVRAVRAKQPNVLTTFWQQSDLDLSRGLDFAPQGPVFVRVTHLQHVPFTYTIKIRNTGRERMGTVRIFMAPHFDERGLPLRLREQRNLFIELDRFVARLKGGDNTIVRSSNSSSVTIPYERTFRNQDRDRPPAGTVEAEQFNYCGCGWPQHMLIPKGTAEGLSTVLFVMVSNYADDQVKQSSTNMCRDGSSYCGIRGELYPDRRAMGFPFDRPPPPSIETLDSFKRLGNGNMASIPVTIFHSSTQNLFLQNKPT